MIRTIEAKKGLITCTRGFSIVRMVPDLLHSAREKQEKFKGPTDGFLARC